MKHVDILIIGAGAAGISAAKAAYQAGCKSILLADRRSSLGGVLLQCTHHGFGKNKTGTEYTADLIADFPSEITFVRNTTVLSVSANKTALLCGPEIGKTEVHFSQLILAAGCREIPSGSLPIAGTRPKGIYTAGQMQEMMNLFGIIPEGPAVILGSGDLGLIMARQLLDVGIPVTIVEQQSTCGGILRNQLPLEGTSVRILCSNTVQEIHGQQDLEGCTLSDGTYLPCRTLLIAVGLRPERELVAGLEEKEWIHLCGNCNSISPMVEGVVKEGTKTGILAWEKIRGTS